MQISFNLIGMGRLGTHLAQALHTNSTFNLRGICTRQLSDAELFCESLRAGEAIATIKDLPKADITFITSPDDAITSIVSELMDNPVLTDGSIVVHCSGVHTSALLAPLKQRGCLIASLHPFNTFSLTRLQSFTDTHCSIEGDVEAVNLLSTIFVQLGAKMICLDSASKPVYHAAAVMASNYLVTLAASAETLLINAGIEQQHAKNMCKNIMTNTLQNIEEEAQTITALTGPLKRNDVQTITCHLASISSPQIEALYRTAGLTTLSFINTSEDIKAKLTSLLTL